MKTFKRVLASLMVAVMVLTAAPLSGFAGIDLPDFGAIFSAKAEAVEDDVLSLSGTTATFTKCDPDASGHIVIPSSIDGRTVTAIGESAFLDCTGVTGVTIPDTVTYINKRAFKNCTALTSIELPDSIIDMEHSVFENCTSLESVVLSDNLTELPDETFMGCSSLVSVTIPDGVTYLGAWAFADCTSLKTVSIGSGVEAIGEGLFQGCESLESVYYNGTRADWAKVMFDINTDSVKNAEIVFAPGNVSDSGACGDNVMWELYEDGTLVFFGSGAMALYASASDVPWNQYADSIKTVVIEQGVTGISGFAFSECSQVTDVYYGGTLAQWCAIYFEDIHANPIQCAEKFCISGIPIDNTLVIPDGVTSIGQFAFAGCEIFEEVGFCAEIESVGTDAFYGCTEVSLVGYLGDLTSWCAINFENAYANPMFYGDELYIGDSYIEGELVIPDGVTSIGSAAFSGCTQLTNVTIPDSVTEIKMGAFAYCTNMTSITIGNGITDIGDHAFNSCNSLETVYYNGTQTQWNEITIGEPNDPLLNAEIVFLVDDRAIIDSGTCGENLTWILYEDGELVISGTGEMYDGLFFHDSVINLTIENGVTSIGELSFTYCYNLTSVTIPDSVIHIADDAFLGCDSLIGITVGENNPAYSSDEYGVLFNKDKTILIRYPHGNERTSYTTPDSVTSIYNCAFSACTNLTNVTIPNSVTSIGDYAFSNCTSLTSITIPDSVTSIGYCAFSYCENLTNIIVDENNTVCSSDEYGVLFNKDKTELIQYPAGNERISYTIPDSVTSIGDYAFAKCDSLANITIPDGVTSIGDYAFYYCSSLDTVYYNGTQTQWNEITIGESNDPLLNAEIVFLVDDRAIVDSGTCGENLTWILYEDGELVISGTGEMTDYSFPTDAPWYNNRSLIKTVTIEDGVTSIGNYAFYDCDSLTNITIPNGVTSIGSRAFSLCDSLTSITIPDSVTSIGNSAFYHCYGLTSVTIPASVTRIEEWAFADCGNLIELMISDGVISIGDFAFSSCSKLEKITIPVSITSIGNKAFSGAESLVSITVDEDNTAYCSDEYGVLFNKDKTVLIQYPASREGTDYNIPETVVSIGDRAFYYCKYLTTITIPDGVAIIRDGAFNTCYELEELTIPASVINIGTEVFVNCFKLKRITVDEGNTAYCSGEYGELFNKDKTILIAFPRKNNVTSYTIPETVAVIADYAFFGHELAVVTFPEGVTHIGENAFGCCDEITSITIPDSVTSVGEGAFHSCDNLTEAILGNGLESISAGVFNSCNNITKVTIPASVRSIEHHAFYLCDTFTEIYFLGTKEQWDAIIIDDTENEALINAQKHYCEKVEAKQVTCEEDGYTEGLYCTDCEKFVVGHEIIPAEGHDYIVDETSATCTTSGKRIHTCSVCGDTYTEMIYATGHDLEDYRLEPTCKETGYECYKCVVCGFEYAREELDVIPHTEGDWEVIEASTCTATGIRSKKCMVCGDEVRREDVPILPHPYEETVITEPTCVAEGLKRFTCAVCGDSYDETIPATGIHTTKDVRIEPTCTAEGEIQHWCEICGNMIGESDAIPMIPHPYEESVVTEPTCVAEGLKRYTCSVCGDSYDEVMPATGEHTVKVLRKEPTCTKIGTEQYICEVCGDMVRDLVILPKLDHSYGEWTVVKDPTATEDGSKEHSCTVCGKAEAATIPAIGFETADGVTVDFEKNIISGFNSGETSLDSYTTIVNENYIWEYETSNGKLGTGSKAILKDGDTVIGEYTILVYGDTNGDSWYD
ncbi:MAG: leucine-rich repeat domain-containing protein, partial [Clostridia bacterium]|nr:leucine-rich repeat domain-containing protein [Clostridia bacterium]